MNTIVLSDGVEVQVELSENEAQEISARSRVENSLKDLQTTITKISESISGYAESINVSDQVKETKISVGLKVGVEGNLILSKSTLDAHINITFTLK